MAAKQMKTRTRNPFLPWPSKTELGEERCRVEVEIVKKDEAISIRLSETEWDKGQTAHSRTKTSRSMPKRQRRMSGRCKIVAKI